MGALSACQDKPPADGPDGDDQSASQGGPDGPAPQATSPSDAVMQYAALYNAHDAQGLAAASMFTPDIEAEGYTFVLLEIVIQNPSAQMEPYEVEFYQEQYEDLTNTAIICVEQTITYTVDATGEAEAFVSYLDYYLVTTESNPNWVIVWVAPQAGQQWVLPTTVS
jgi:hypothetical protein